MLRNKPRLTYSGLTIILSNPSRFDITNLLSGPANPLFNNHCLRPDFNLMQCDIRVMEDTSEFLPNTKCILLLGEAAMHKYCPNTRNNSLNEMRGSPLEVNGIPAYASFFPQDATDIKNHEANINKESKEYTGNEDYETENEGDEKDFSPTKRGNYAFWLKRDVWKAKQVIKNKPFPIRQGIFHIYPSADEVIISLTSTKGKYLYFDIETDYEEQNLLCFSYSFDGVNVYSVPALDNNYQWAYSSVHFIMRALAIAIRDNTLVAHNGASFDFFVLGYKYHVPVYKCYDTMLAMHRCFPDVEKSLGHCTSYWLNTRFHKDTDSRAYMTREHMMQKLNYCAKDVHTMAGIHEEITKYARTIPGLDGSIQCAMDSIRPYLLMSLQGIRYNQEKVDKKKNENDRLMMQYIRMIKLLMGETADEACRKQIKVKAKAFPGSNTQCCHYFHEQLGYAVVARSLKTQKPSLAKKAMFRLALKYPNNPIVTLVCAYREVAKEYGALKFIPFRDDNNEIYREEVTSSTQTKVSSGLGTGLLKGMLSHVS